METLTHLDIETDNTIERNGFVFCSMLIGENLHNRLNKHVDRLKATEGPGQSKQKWVVDAIKEKLKTEDLSEDIPRAKIISVKISKTLHDQIVKRIEMMRKVRKSFSKKQWVVEAISEKLDRDEREIQKNLQNLTR